MGWREGDLRDSPQMSNVTYNGDAIGQPETNLYDASCQSVSLAIFVLMFISLFLTINVFPIILSN